MNQFRTHVTDSGPSATKTRVEWRGASITMHCALELLASEPDFRRGLIDALRGARFSAYFWETPAISRTASSVPFEYVLSDAPAFLSVSPEPNAFREHFSKDADGDGIVTFRNLSGDATLVVPCPIEAHASYTHLATFVRGAPAAQVDAFFKAVGVASLARLSDSPQWLSTAGMGVYWLHARLDSRPKYYRYEPYKAPPRST